MSRGRGSRVQMNSESHLRARDHVQAFGVCIVALDESQHAINEGMLLVQILCEEMCMPV